jgi:hypothetical protein
LGDELRRLSRRIVIENSGLRHVTLYEPDALALLEVDGRKKNH